MNNVPSDIKNTSGNLKRYKKNFITFFTHSFYTLEGYYSRWYMWWKIQFQFYMSLLYCCINLSAVFILTLLIHTIITNGSVVLLLHFVQFWSLLYSWCIMGVFVLYIFVPLYFIYQWLFRHPIWLFYPS